MRLVNYHTADEHRVAIVDEPGTKWLHLVFFDPTELRVTNVPLSEARFMRDISSRPRIKLSPLATTARHWLRTATGATQGAKAILKKAADYE